MNWRAVQMLFKPPYAASALTMWMSGSLKMIIGMKSNVWKHYETEDIHKSAKSTFDVL